MHQVQPVDKFVLVLIKCDFCISTHQVAGFLRILQPLTAPECVSIHISLCGGDVKQK